MKQYLLTVAISVILLWFNERKAAINSYRLQYARQNCISLTPFQESNPEDLIHITGQLITDELVTDKVFGVSQINCVKLYRNVEMYQWVVGEKQKEQQWVDHYVENSFGYIDRIQLKFYYNNDKSKWILNSEIFVNISVKLHQFELPEDMKTQLNTPLETVKLNQANVQIFQQRYKDKGYRRFLLQDDYIYMHQVEDQIVNGDLRICFKQVICSDATIVAKGIINSLLVWQFEDTYHQTVSGQNQVQEKGCCDIQLSNENKPIKEIYWIFQGLFTPEECLQKVVNENALLFWVFRSIGYILIAVGSLILLSPVSQLSQLIKTDQLSGFGYIIYGLIGAIPITILSICFCWLYYRPKIGLLMLLIRQMIISYSQLLGYSTLSLILGGSIFYYAYKNQ